MHQNFPPDKLSAVGFIVSTRGITSYIHSQVSVIYARWRATRYGPCVNDMEIVHVCLCEFHPDYKLGSVIHIVEAYYLLLIMWAELRQLYYIQ